MSTTTMTAHCSLNASISTVSRRLPAPVSRHRADFQHAPVAIDILLLTQSLRNQAGISHDLLLIVVRNIEDNLGTSPGVEQEIRDEELKSY